jgi:glycosyltransferase involved in cell wall biosynthesis
MLRKKNIRILHIEGATSYGGSVTCLKMYLRALNADDVNRHSVLYYNQFEGLENFNDIGVRTKTLLNYTRTVADRKSNLLQQVLRRIKVLTCLYLEIRRVDVVHLNNDLRAHTIVPRVAKYLKKPVVFHLRSFFNEKYFDKDNYLKLLPINSLAISVSLAVRDSYVNKGLEATHMPVIYDGVECDAITEKDDTLKNDLLRGRKKIVGVVSRLVRWKGVETFIEAAVKFVLSGNTEIRFIVIGDEDEVGYKSYLEKLAEPAGDAILFTGRIVDGVSRYMSVFDLLVLPSIEPEPFGMVLLEAMALGVPVVASRHGGPVEIIEDGVSGMLFDPGDVQGLVDAITQVVSEEEKMASLSEKASEVLSEKFDIRKTCAQYAECFYDAYVESKN